MNASESTLNSSLEQSISRHNIYNDRYATPPPTLDNLLNMTLCEFLKEYKNTSLLYKDLGCVKEGTYGLNNILMFIVYVGCSLLPIIFMFTILVSPKEQTDTTKKGPRFPLAYSLIRCLTFYMFRFGIEEQPSTAGARVSCTTINISEVKDDADGKVPDISVNNYSSMHQYSTPDHFGVRRDDLKPTEFVSTFKFGMAKFEPASVHKF